MGFTWAVAGVTLLMSNYTHLLSSPTDQLNQASPENTEAPVEFLITRYVISFSSV